MNNDVEKWLLDHKALLDNNWRFYDVLLHEWFRTLIRKLKKIYHKASEENKWTSFQVLNQKRHLCDVCVIGIRIMCLPNLAVLK